MHEKIIVRPAALGQLSPRTRKQPQRREPANFEDVQRTNNSTGLRQQIFWRLHISKAGSRYELSTSRHGQNQPSPLPWTTSGSDRGGITLAEHELQSLRKSRFAVGSFNHNLDQDHRETMFRTLAPIQHVRFVPRACPQNLRLSSAKRQVSTIASSAVLRSHCDAEQPIFALLKTAEGHHCLGATIFGHQKASLLLGCDSIEGVLPLLLEQPSPI